MSSQGSTVIRIDKIKKLFGDEFYSKEQFQAKFTFCSEKSTWSHDSLKVSTSSDYIYTEALKVEHNNND